MSVWKHLRKTSELHSVMTLGTPHYYPHLSQHLHSARISGGYLYVLKTSYFTILGEQMRHIGIQDLLWMLGVRCYNTLQRVSTIYWYYFINPVWFQGLYLKGNFPIINIWNVKKTVHRELYIIMQALNGAEMHP